MHNDNLVFSLCSLDRTNKGESLFNAFCTMFFKKALHNYTCGHECFPIHLFPNDHLCRSVGMTKDY